MDADLRPIAEGEWDDAFRVDTTAFGETPVDAEEGAAWRAAHDPDRSLGVFERDRVVAVTAARPFELTLPGPAWLTVAGITGMAVLPTHRRQGLLRRMMRHQLEDAARRGEAVAALTASESSIYGRFGFGPATSDVGVELGTAHAALAVPSPPGRVTMLDGDELTKVLPPILDRARLSQPGDVDRSPEWWRLMLLDPERERDGATERLHVVHSGGAGGADGYASYRVRCQAEHGLSRSRAMVDELVALTPDAHAALWQFLVSIDLVDVVEARRRPVEDPLRWLLADPRRLRVIMLADQVWLRLLDVEVALAARRYPVAGRLVLEISDPSWPEAAGRYELDGGPDGAGCRRTSAGPDLSLGAGELGAVYLGGVSVATLAAAGRVVEHRPGAIARADAMLASRPLPYCRTPF